MRTWSNIILKTILLLIIMQIRVYVETYLQVMMLLLKSSISLKSSLI